jgi:receptor protein-tyrosine kinase
MIALVTLLAVALSLAWTLRQPPMYTSTTRLFVSTSADASPSTGDQAGDLAVQRVRSYAALLDGDQIARQVAERLTLGETPHQLSQRIHASVDSKTTLLSIRVSDPSAERARVLANAVSKEFIAFVGNLEVAGTGSDAPTVKVTVVDSATKPTSPSSPRPVLNLGIGLLVGLLLGGLIAVLRERFDSTVRSADALEQATGAPLLGAILVDKHANDEPTIRELDSYDPRVEAFRVVRTGVQFIHPDATSKVFVVTSAVPGEGKTTTAINLALILADGGEKVALIEGDLRRPAVSEYLGLVEAVGLTTVLVGRQTLAEATQEVGTLGVLTSGRKPPNPAELVKSEAMHALVDQLREQYTYVLIDAPPLLPVADASLLAANSDGVILVTRYGGTKQTELATAVKRIASVGGTIVGTFLNMAPASDIDGHGYGYGYAPENHDADAARTAKQKKVAAETSANPVKEPPAPKPPKEPKEPKAARKSKLPSAEPTLPMASVLGPVTESVMEPLAAEPARIEMPRAEAPVVDKPVVEHPAIEAPVVEVPPVNEDVTWDEPSLVDEPEPEIEPYEEPPVADAIADFYRLRDDD